MTEINRQPSGLSDFLQVQAGGRNPDDLAQVIRPTIDVEPFYWPDRLRAAVEPTSMSAGQIEFIEVPEGEVWKILNISMEAQLAATAGYGYYNFGLERIQPLGLNPIYLGSVELTNISGTANATVLGKLDQDVPLILTSGQRITTRCVYENSAGAQVGNLYVLYVLLQDPSA